MSVKSSLLYFSALTARCTIQRYLTTSSFVQSKAAAKYTRKFLIGNKEKKRVWHEGKIMSNPASLFQPQRKGEGNSHRLTVLNKVFMENISDIMATGNISEHIAGHGLEITKVRVLPGMTGINVYWISSNTTHDVSKVLQAYSKDIRHELSQLRILGHIPHITFVKDQRFHKLVEVERRLSIADFGEDFEPTDATHHIKSSLTVKTMLNEELRDAISEIEQDSVTSSENAVQVNEPLSDLPAMKSDVLGVETDKIFAMVQQGMSKAEASHRNLEQGAILSRERGDGLGNVASRTEEIKRWASQYRDKKKKGRSQNEEQRSLKVPQRYVISNTEEMEYFEEKDYIEEDLPLYK